MSRTRLEIAHDWQGSPIAPDEKVRLDLCLEPARLVIEVEAPLHGDPPPPEPAGSIDGLWNHEVVELFLLGDDDRYLEIELGPWGHYLVLELAGPRNVVAQGRAIDYETQRGAAGWAGRAVVPAAWIPEPIGLGNAYAIHGSESSRRYLALHPVPGDAPDFHRLDCFGPIGL
ncbi:MAG: hypothetical protein OEV20_04995 [Actinomycetota bacterium]|nr:hypothetical protein [Actinomycetota bacterium]